MYKKHPRGGRARRIFGLSLASVHPETSLSLSLSRQKPTGGDVLFAHAASSPGPGPGLEEQDGPPAAPRGRGPQRHARDGRHALVLERLAGQGRERRRLEAGPVEAQRLGPGRGRAAVAQRPASPAPLPAGGRRALRAPGLLRLDGVQAQQRGGDGGGRGRGGPAGGGPRPRGLAQEAQGCRRRRRRRRRPLAGLGLCHLPISC